MNKQLRRRLASLALVLVASNLLFLNGMATPAQAANRVRPRVAGPNLSVDAAAQRHTISPDIYGMNFYGTNYNDYTSLMQEIRLPVDRWGGNVATRYNWQTNSFNSGLDYYFEGNTNTGNDPNLGQPSESDDFVARDQAHGVKSLVEVPTIGYVEKDRTDHLCGFSVAKYGPQQATDAPYAPDCGNGRHTDGSLITGNDPTDTSVAVGPSFIQGWVNHFVGQYGTAANGGVKIYELDNEPSDWFETHRDVHPGQLTYDELRNYTYQYAPAIKAADATAQTLGPSNFGYYVYADSQVPGDKANHGNVGFSEWYLQQMKLYEQQHGIRILDYFDQHYYPAQANVSLEPAGDAATQQLRLRSTRSLWDPTYVDESWIGDPQQGNNPPIQLIPTFHNWIDTNYPGTKLAISEYNFGGLEDINGALTQADVLGIFGRERVDLATLWEPPASNQPGAYAFRIYRNYDGAGSAYGDTWVQSASDDQGSLAIYGAQRSSDQALTLVIINKTSNDLTSPLSLANFTPGNLAQVYRYSAANLNAIVRQADQAINPGGFSATYPANSITLVVIPKATGKTWAITAASDDGTGSFAQALQQAQFGDTISLQITGKTLNLTGGFTSGVILANGVGLNAGDCSTGQTTIQFNGQPGLTLAGNNFVQNLRLIGMSGPGLKNTGGGNHLLCTAVQPGTVQVRLKK